MPTFPRLTPDSLCNTAGTDGFPFCPSDLRSLFLDYHDLRSLSRRTALRLAPLGVVLGVADVTYILGVPHQLTQRNKIEIY